ncbi:MAG: leucyl aminopeptidase [Planctomycetota bacterium]
MKVRTPTQKQVLARQELATLLVSDSTRFDVDEAVKDGAKRCKRTGDLKTSRRAASLFHRPAGARGEPKRLGFVGLGDAKNLDTETLRRAAAVAQQQAERVGVDLFEVLCCADELKAVEAFDAGAAIAEGLLLGAYRYQPPRKEKPKKRSAQTAVVRLFDGKQGADWRKAFERGLKFGSIGGEATIFARDIENMAGNHATPSRLADEAKGFAGTNLKVKILEEKDMEKLGMYSLLGVSRGSVQPAKLILMDYAPRGYKKTVCVVGKGLTFDSGGISIKPSGKMDEMRYDMCGGGAVLGLFHAIAAGALKDVGPKTRIVGIVPSSENMPDADAQKPGDVVTAMDGTTIEVLNTDAEGRLILADALAYAVKNYEPDSIVDLATLTGAVVVALGHEVAGVMGNDDEHIEDLIDAGDAADEPNWQLPLWPAHRDQMKSNFADLKNIQSPAHGNGTIAGAAFLSYFVGDTTWAHIDIAGTAWGGRAKDYYRSGAAGTAVRMLLRWCRGLS